MKIWKTIKRPFTNMFDLEHVLTPIAVEHVKSLTPDGGRTARYVYIFGVRIGFYATTKFQKF